MAKPLRLALLAGASALGAALISVQPAAAQFALPWGIWAGPLFLSRFFSPESALSCRKGSSSRQCG